MLGFNPLASAPLGDDGIQSSDLTATAIATGTPTVASSSLTQLHILAPSAISTGNPSVSTAGLTQVHSLTASAIAAGTPAVASLVLIQVHGIAGSISVGAPTVSNAVLTQTHILSTVDLTLGNPVVSSTGITQVHSLSSPDLATGTPTVASVGLIQAHLVSGSLTIGTPTVANAVITQLHVLVGSAVSTGPPVVNNMNMSEYETFTTSDMSSGEPLVAQAVLTQEHDLTATAVASANPVTGAPLYSEDQILGTTGITTGTPVVSSTGITQVHTLSNPNLALGTPSVSSTGITQVHTLSNSNLVSGTPSTGTPSVTSFTLSMSPSDVETGTPVVAATGITQAHTLSISDLTLSNPSVSTTGITQVHVLQGSSLTTTYTVPQINLTQEYALTATAVASGNPSISTTGVTQEHSLTSTNIVTGASVVGSPVAEETSSSLSVSNIVTGSPSVGTSGLTQVHTFSTSNITTGIPLVNSSQVGIAYALTATSVVSGAPLNGFGFTNVESAKAQYFNTNATLSGSYDTNSYSSNSSYFSEHSHFHYVDTNSISVTSAGVLFNTYALYNGDWPGGAGESTSTHKWRKYLITLNFSGSPVASIVEQSGVTTTATPAGIAASSTVHEMRADNKPSTWYRTRDSHSTIVGAISTALASSSYSSENPSWLSSNSLTIDLPPSTYTGHANKFTIVDTSLVGTSYTTSSSGVHDDITVSNSLINKSNAHDIYAGSPTHTGTNYGTRDNNKLVIANRWLITSTNIWRNGYAEGYGSNPSGVTTITRIDPPAIVQSYGTTITGQSMGVDDISTGTPTVAASAISQVHILPPLEVECPSPSVNQAELTQHHSLSAVSVQTIPLVSDATYSEGQTISAISVVTNSPVVGTPNIVTLWSMYGVVTGQPVVGQTEVSSQVHVFLTANLVTPAPVVEDADGLDISVHRFVDINMFTSKADTGVITDLGLPTGVTRLSNNIELMEAA